MYSKLERYATVYLAYSKAAFLFSSRLISSLILEFKQGDISPWFVWVKEKNFKVLNKREERSNNVGKPAVVIPQIFREKLGALVRLLGITKA